MRRRSLIFHAGALCLAAASASGQSAPDARPLAENPPPAVGIARFARGGLDTSGPASKHEFLAQHIGEWTGTLRTWPRPGSPPVESECTMTVSSMLEGRFIRVETSAEIPGVGPFFGLGVHGFDNSTQRFQGSWIDSLHAGVLSGTGELDADAGTLAWTITFLSPLTKQPTTLRRIERRTGKDAMSIEFIETDPASGAERRSIEMTLTREPMKGPAGRCAVVPTAVRAPKEQPALPD